MINKEKNFISAVVYIDSKTKNVMPFFDTINSIFEDNFENFEFIVCNNACTNGNIEKLRNWARGINAPLTFLHMSMPQSVEACMNAGLDAAIGDYIYEFDVIAEYGKDLPIQAYNTAIEGSDIVNICPNNSSFFSKLFYKIFNKNSKSAYPIRTNLFRLVSRRAVNRVHASSAYLPYRKAAYAASGLKSTDIEYNGKIEKNASDRFSLAIDSLILYTDACFKISVRFTILMIFITVLESIYTIAVFFTGHPIEGWTTTMLVLTVGFTGLFAVAAILIKYLSILLNIEFKKQEYLIENIEKIQK